MDELNALNQRVSTLERRLRLATGVGLMLPLIAGAALILGQAAPSNQTAESKRVIEVEEFLVRDRQGNPCIRIGAENNTPSLKILDREGTTIVLLKGWSDNSHVGRVQVQAKNGMTASMSASSDSVSVSLNTGMDKRAFEAWRRDVKEGKDPLVAMQEHSDPKRSSGVNLSLDEIRSEILIRKDGQQRGGWFADSDQTQLSLYDKEGKARGFWDIDNGTTALHLLDSSMNSRLVLGGQELKNLQSGNVQRRSESSIVLFGEEGKVIFSAP